jgi:flagellar brake protein
MLSGIRTMYQDTQPATLDSTNPAAWDAFRVDSPAEVLTLLRQMRDTGIALVLSAPSGSVLVTTLWSIDVDQRRVNFSADDNSPALLDLVDANEAVAVGYLDNVKLQFDLGDLLVVRGAKSCTLQAESPTTLYRFQRRNAFRVRTLERHAPTARLRHPAIPDMRLELRVLDVSIGGCALFLPADMPGLEPGVVLHGVQVELDADTRFGATVQVHHISAINTQALGQRAGCEWCGLSPDSERSLQRYIDQTQKRRRLLSLD